MSDMMVIVSKAVFEKARDGDGAPLEIGSTYETTAYLSNSSSIEKNLTGDLYLVTVRDERLWLLARLVSPAHNGMGWASHMNEEAIVDITDIAGEIRFTNDKGINLEKMAMSLQTPRVLSDADVELLERAWGYEPEAPIEVTPEQIEAAVVKVLAAVLEKSEDEIRNDGGRYGAFQWDDGFYEYFWEIDWTGDEPVLEADWYTEDWIYGRVDVDIANSVFADEHFLPESTTDASLRELFASQKGGLYGTQLAELVKQERVALGQLEYPSIFSRLQATGESLVEAATAMFMLNDFPDLRMVPGEYAEVDEEWVELIDSIEPPALGAHIGMFFQEPQSARCVGAALTGPDEGTFIEIDGQPQQETVVSWWIGEGQGDCYIARLLGDVIPEVPEFRGRELLTRPAEPERPEKSCLVGSSAEVLDIPLEKHLEGVENEDFRAFIQAVGDRDMTAFIAGISIAQGNVWKLLTPIGGLDREGNAHAALSLLHTVRGVMTEGERQRTALRWAQRLYALGCYAEAVEAYAECEKIGELCSEYFMRNFGHVYANYARAALDAGEYQLALEKADAALEEEEELGVAFATKACALFALGREDEAFELVDQVMQHGTDPYPQRELSEHPRYRELALEHSIAVPIFGEG